MVLDYNDLKAYVGGSEKNSGLLERYWNLAKLEVDGWVNGCTLIDPTHPIPEEVLDECYLQVAASHYDTIKGPSNAGQLSDGVVQLRVARDPMRPAYELLARWVVPF